jgi:amino-acid N-acetyltransferase
MDATSTTCMWKIATATRIRTTKLTSRIAVMLIMTLSSCLFRESVSLIAERVSYSGNGAIGRNRLYRLTAAGANARILHSKDNNRPKNRSFFQNHTPGDRVGLSMLAYPKGTIGVTRNSNIYNDEFRNQNRYRTNQSIHHRYNRSKNCSAKSIFTRNLSTNAKAAEAQENCNQGDPHTESNDKNNHQKKNTQSTSKNNDTIASSTRSEKEPLVNVLSIDPEHVDIYERTDKIGFTNEENELDNGLVNNNNPFRNLDFINMFRGSANYIASHRNTLAVFHIPGDLMDENPAGFRDLMNDISLSWLLGMKIVIVAGCRYQINKRQKKDNARQEHMGMVVTDPESLRIVKEEAGYVRFEVERQLARALKSGSSSGNRNDNGNANGNGSDSSDAVGGNVVSGNFYSAQPFGVLDGVDYQYSGFIRRMEVNKIHQVHKNRDIVLLTSLGFSPTGEVFNVNSEYLAAYAAGELGASKIIYFLEKNAALRHKIHGSNIPHLRVHDGSNLLNLNGVRTETKGFVYVDDCPYDYGAEQLFLVKMGWGMNALKAGVKRVHLISPYDGALLQELYTRDGSGTMISGDLYDGIQSATVDDITAIHEVITPLVEKGTLVERTKAELERDIDQYHVYTRDGLLIACGQLKMFENGYAEFGCLVVNPLYRSKGRGDAMLGYLERLCVQNGATTMFVLSTQTMEWFVERGFDEVGVELLPPSRQASYNHDRGSKIYMKKVNSLRDLDASELFWDR